MNARVTTECSVAATDEEVRKLQAESGFRRKHVVYFPVADPNVCAVGGRYAKVGGC